MQALAQEYAEHSIRVNTIHPTGVVSGMTTNEAMMKMAADPNTNISAMQNLLPIQILQPEDIANAVAYLVSDEAQFITGTQWALDAGFSVRCGRSEERRVGKECVRTCRSRWYVYH